MGAREGLDILGIVEGKSLGSESVGKAVVVEHIPQETIHMSATVVYLALY